MKFVVYRGKRHKIDSIVLLYQGIINENTRCDTSGIYRLLSLSFVITQCRYLISPALSKVGKYQRPLL